MGKETKPIMGREKSGSVQRELVVRLLSVEFGHVCFCLFVFVCLIDCFTWFVFFFLVLFCLNIRAKRQDNTYNSARMNTSIDHKKYIRQNGHRKMMDEPIERLRGCLLICNLFKPYFIIFSLTYSDSS